MREPSDRDRIARPASVARQRWVVVGIMMLPVAVILLSSLLWWMVQRGQIDLLGMLGTHNQGTLLAPAKSIEELPLLDAKGEAFDYLAGERKWGLLIPGGADCDEQCRQTLWLTRQLHTALGRRALYLRRYYLTSELPLAAEFAKYLAGEQPGLTVLQVDASALAKLAETAATGGGEPAYYLVDKQGYIMMYYTVKHSGEQVIDDIKFLMKQTGDD